MRALTTMLAALLWAAPAHALDVGGTFQLEMGTVHNEDRAFDLFSHQNGMPSRGIRGGVRLGENVSVLAGWHRVRRGSEVYIPTPGATDPTYYDYYDGDDYVVMAFFADEFTLGAQLGLPLFEAVVYPYAAVDGMLMRGVMKLDDDTSTKQNANQLKAEGWAPGLLTLGGVELRTPTRAQGWQAALFFESGYSWFLSADYGDFGPMQVGGYTARGGIGMRF